MSEIKVTINTYPDSSFGISSWNIRDKQDEPERVSVRRDGKEYSIVFDKPVRIEVWSVDDRGELGDRLTMLPLEEEEISSFRFWDGPEGE